MTDTSLAPSIEPGDSERNTLLIAYVLYFATFVTGVAGIAGVILCHIKGGESANEFLRSHYRWLIRTFWFSLLWTVLCVVLMFTIILIPLCWLGLAVTTVWYLYRLIRGVINFNERRAMPV